MNTTHTPEPWRVYAWRNDSTFAVEYIQPSGISAFVCQMNGSNGQSEANASRIVACVNACAGMEDPAAEIERLKAQRDELLRLLELALSDPKKLDESSTSHWMAKRYPVHPTVQERANYYAQFVDAIAKAKGGSHE
jgi:hypothetical protein